MTIALATSLSLFLAVVPPGFGDHTRKVTTASALAQDRVDEGLGYLAAFNHDEAARAFHEAAAADPSCALCVAMEALALGPNINAPTLPPEREATAHAAVTRAVALKDKASAEEQALIDALRVRHPAALIKDPKKRDRAYADAMREVTKRFPEDVDLAAWFAESLLTLRPWDQWTKDGRPQPGTEEALRALEGALHRNSAHPHANHLWIHALESSPFPERATDAAQRLRTLAPGLGHLLHMPSHIDVRTGRWQEAIVANEKAIAVDDAYLTLHPETGMYRTYILHNRHMLAFAAMMTGQSALALMRMKELEAQVPAEWVELVPLDVDGVLALRYEVLVRFGRWDELLLLKEPHKALPLSRALWLYGRGVARAAKGDPKGARAEHKRFVAARDAVPKGQKFGANDARALVKIAEQVLLGEIALAEQNPDAAVRALEKAVAAEDALKYDEPPDWILPARHALGVTLLKYGRYDEAEAVYRADLARWPDNVWSLWGLTTVLVLKSAPDAELERRFSEVKAKADVPLKTSCFCVPGI